MVKTRRTATAKDKKTRRSKVAARRPGAAHVSKRLNDLIELKYDRSRTRFAAALAGSKGRGGEMPPTTQVSGWCDGGILPGAAMLARIARVADVSTDWLLGFDVPMRRTDREVVGDLARVIVQELVRRYDESDPRGRRDGLAHVLGGVLQESQSDPPGVGRQFSPQPGDLLPDGRTVLRQTLLGLQLLAIDPQSALDRVYQLVLREALAWEESHQEAERTQVRAALAALSAHLSPADHAQVGRLMVLAMHDPLDTKVQARLHAALRDVSSLRRKVRRIQESNAAFEHELAGILDGLEVDGSFVTRRARKRLSTTYTK